MNEIEDGLAARLRETVPGTAVLSALQELLRRDAHLLKVDANERSITHRLAMYLQQELPDLHVDCEYNRDGADPKRLGYFHLERPDTADTDAHTVFPDIIAHIRDTDQNYLVIEAKKD
jgi:hypothetical protein